jgi:hypothetical protein
MESFSTGFPKQPDVTATPDDPQNVRFNFNAPEQIPAKNIRLIFLQPRSAIPQKLRRSQSRKRKFYDRPH